MSNMTKIVTAFWVIIIGILLWQFYSYNKGLDQQAIDHPQQTQFFFFKTNSAPVAPAPVQKNGPDVQQVGYRVAENVPSDGNFTVYVTLKNVGNAKAAGVQVHVRPYRGMRLGDEDAGNSPLHILPEDDPLSQYGEWVYFSDLAPGESSTQSVIFLSRAGATPVVMGSSDTGIPGQPMEKIVPEIVFGPAKSQ